MAAPGGFVFSELYYVYHALVMKGVSPCGKPSCICRRERPWPEGEKDARIFGTSACV